MSIFSNLFGKKRVENTNDDVQTNVEEFMSLVRIYYQAAIVAQVGITNLNMVPEFAMFKRMMRIPTVGGKLGVGEKTHVRKMMMTNYGLQESFFKEIDSSIRRNCKSMRDIQGYFFAFGNFTSDLMNYLTADMQWRLQAAMLFKSFVRPTVNSAINKLMTKQYWKDASMTKIVNNLRASKATLGYSDTWTAEFISQVVLMSRKDAKEKRFKK